MSEPQGDFRAAMREAWQEMRQLADQVRLKIHLAGMNAKGAWKELEPRIEEFGRKAEAATHEISSELERLATQLKNKLRGLRDELPDE